MKKCFSFKWLIVCFVIALAVWGIVTTAIPIDKKCKTVEDCVFVRTKCCPGCTGFDSVNVDAAQRIEAKINRTCNEQCPLIECESETGFVIAPVPVCIDNICSSADELNCNLFCKYYNDSTDSIYSEYLIKTGQLMMKSVDNIAKNCYC